MSLRQAGQKSTRDSRGERPTELDAVAGEQPRDAIVRTVAMLASRPRISGPIPKIVPTQVKMFELQGYSVDVAYWGSRYENEPLWSKLFWGPRDLVEALRLLATGRQDVLFVNTAHDAKSLLRDIPLLWFTRRQATSRVLLLHGTQSQRLVAPGSWLLKLASRYLARSADAILLLSTSEMVNWRTFDSHGTYFVVVNPYVPGQELAKAATAGEQRGHRPGECPRVLFVGRLMPEKGALDLLRAIRFVNDVRPCGLTYAGDGPLKARLEVQAREFGLADRVQVRGYLDAAELANEYASSDLFVLPTYWTEGFPTVIAEAMSVGLPVVTTSIRGAADLLDEGENCLFVPPRDPTALATQILLLLGDSQLALQMSIANKLRVREFEPLCAGAVYVSAFEAACAARRTAQRG